MKIGKLRMQYGNEDDQSFQFANIGNGIRAYALTKIYRKIGVKDTDVILIKYSDLRTYDGEEIIMPVQLWLATDTIERYYPLSEKIHPVFLDCHLVDDAIENRYDIKLWLKQYEPIGCRDEWSRDILRSHGIAAYTMGCYSLAAFDKRDSCPKNGKIFLVDVSSAAFNKIPQSIRKRSKIVSHSVSFEKQPIDENEDDRLYKLASKYLDMYKNEAEMIISSRLHALLPAMAMGIPVIAMADNFDFRFSFIDKFIPLYQKKEYNTVDWDTKSVDLEAVRELILQLFDRALKQEDYKHQLEALDELYSDRTKTEYFETFKTELKEVEKRVPDVHDFKYCIWGGGQHCNYVFLLMKQMYPYAHLTCIVDKYKRGTRFNVPIIGKNRLEDYSFDIILISTNPGRIDAINYANKKYGKEADSKYIEVHGQQNT